MCCVEIKGYETENITVMENSEYLHWTIIEVKLGREKLGFPFLIVLLKWKLNCDWNFLSILCLCLFATISKTVSICSTLLYLSLFKILNNRQKPRNPHRAHLRFQSLQSVQIPTEKVNSFSLCMTEIIESKKTIRGYMWSLLTIRY